MLRAGASQIDITPEGEVALGGSFEARMTREVLSRLYSSAVAIDDGVKRFIFVSNDLAMMDDEEQVKLRERIAEGGGSELEHVALFFTHTHNAPVMDKRFGRYPRDEEATRRIRDKMVEAGVQASKNLKEARMGYGRGIAMETFNRRVVLKTGQVWMSPGPNDPPVVGREGAEDYDFQTVWFETPEGKEICVLVNYQAHPTCTFFIHKLCADFPGEIRRTVQESVGGDVPVLYLQGACGNLSPVNFFDREKTKPSYERAVEVGQRVGAKVVRAIEENRGSAVRDVSLAHAASTISAPARHATSIDMPLAEARRFVEEHPLEEIDITHEPTMQKYYFASAIVELEGAEPFRESYPVELSVFRLGSVAIATNPAELFVEYQLEIKDRSPFGRTIVTELTNGWCGYIPTERALAGGSYEARLAPSSKLAPKAGEMLVAETLALLNKLETERKT
jgi:hypothetical protein